MHSFECERAPAKCPSGANAIYLDSKRAENLLEHLCEHIKCICVSIVGARCFLHLLFFIIICGARILFRHRLWVACVCDSNPRKLSRNYRETCTEREEKSKKFTSIERVLSKWTANGIDKCHLSDSGQDFFSLLACIS